MTATDGAEVARLVSFARRCLAEQRADVNNNMPCLARLYALVVELVDLEQPVTVEHVTKQLTSEYGPSVVAGYSAQIAKVRACGRA